MKRFFESTRASLVPAVLAVVLVTLVAYPRAAAAQIPPTVLPYIDLKCYGITDPNGAPLPPLNFPLVVEHLNPLLIQMQAPREVVRLLDPFQLCVPVAKNFMDPPPDALDFIQWIDLKCYHIQSDPPALNRALRLVHQNPVIRDLVPPEQVIEDVFVREVQKLCVPVAKSNPDGSPAFPPPGIIDSVKFIDQKCYQILSPTGGALPPLNLSLHLEHKNPVLPSDVAPPEDVIVTDPQQLCVPIKKNQMPPPTPDIRVIEQIDLKCYAMTSDPPDVGLPPLGLPQKLFHLNPVFPATMPPEDVVVQEPQQLCVPVQKQLPGAGNAKEK